MQGAASIHFDCPECHKSLHVYLNISAKRAKGDNERTCECGAHIIIQIDIYTTGNNWR